MGQLARGVDWSVESGVAALRSAPSHSYEAPRDYVEESFQPADDEAEASTLRPSGVTAKLAQVSPFVVGDPDDDDVPPTLRSAGLLQLVVETPPSTDDLIVAPPRRPSGPIVVLDASLPIPRAVDADRVEVW